jgi:hypothetical protein
MLNPSTADADQDDPTIRKCIGFADRLGFGAIVVANLFAFRATDPANLRRAGYLVGPENDHAIAAAARDSNLTICAWGAHARGLARPGEAHAILRGIGVTPKALDLTADGIPRHPLMLRYSDALFDLPGVR